MKILGITGSLREKSYNTALLREAVKAAPDGMEIEMYVPGRLPLYNGDIEAAGFPESVLDLKQKVKAADGILIMSPEYNHSVPGVLKNAIDWVSRGDNEWRDKPLAIAGGSDGFISTARGQMQLLIIANTLSMHAMARPLFQVPNVDKKIDDNGYVTDEKTRQKLSEFLIAFKKWVERLS